MILTQARNRILRHFVHRFQVVEHFVRHQHLLAKHSSVAVPLDVLSTTTISCRFHSTPCLQQQYHVGSSPALSTTTISCRFHSTPCLQQRYHVVSTPRLVYNNNIMSFPLHAMASTKISCHVQILNESADEVTKVKY